MPAAVAQKSCQVAQKQHKGKPLLTPAQKLWYNFWRSKSNTFVLHLKVLLFKAKKSPYNL